MSLEITGNLNQVLPEQRGQGRNGEWVKQDFVIETEGDYPKKICFSVWGDKKDVLATLQPGSPVKVSFDIESREYNGKWYTNTKAWKVESISNQGGADMPPPLDPNDMPPMPEEDGLPF